MQQKKINSNTQTERLSKQTKAQLVQLVVGYQVMSDTIDNLSKTQKETEIKIMELMKEAGITTFETGNICVEHMLPGFRLVLDAELLKTEVPDLFLAYAIDVPVKEKIKMREKYE